MPSPRANRLTRAHQAELAAIGDLVEQEVRRLAAGVTVADVDAWFRRVLEELLTLVAGAFGGSRTLAARYLRQHAALEGLSVEPVLAQWSTAQAVTSLRVTGPVEWKRHLAETGDEVGATQAMQTTMAASAQRLALAGSRETVAETVRDSDAIVGWRRVVDEDPCAWCAMLASRGAVYRTAESAGRVVGRRGVTRGTRQLGQQYHDGDQCTVEPLYEREEEPPEVQRLQDLWREVTAGHSGRAAIREWRRWWDEHRGAVDLGAMREPEPEPERESEPATVTSAPQPPQPPQPMNPAQLTGRGMRWWENLGADTGDTPVPVRDLEIAPGYTIRRGQAWRIDGVAYLVEARATLDARRIVDEFRMFHRGLPGDAGQYQRAYAWLGGRNPEDAYWADQYDLTDFRSLATAGDGSVRVWGQHGVSGPMSYEDELRHEFGHNVSSASRDRGLHDRAPAWREAGRIDGRRPGGIVRDFRPTVPHARRISLRERPDRPYPVGVTQYGTSSPGEDYAESVSLYLAGPLGGGVLPGGTTEVPVYFRDLFPARAAVLDQLFPQVAAQQRATTAAR